MPVESPICVPPEKTFVPETQSTVQTDNVRKALKLCNRALKLFAPRPELNYFPGARNNGKSKALVTIPSFISWFKSSERQEYLSSGVRIFSGEIKNLLLLDHL